MDLESKTSLYICMMFTMNKKFNMHFYVITHREAAKKYIILHSGRRWSTQYFNTYS